MNHNHSIRKIAFFIAALLFVSIQLFAQKGKEDVVYLKNGSIIHGRIIEIKINESITIINNCGDTIVINQDEIDRVEKTDLAIRKEKMRDTTTTPKTYKYSGFYSSVQMFLLKGSMEDTPLPNISMLFTGGYQFNGRLNAGIGIGIDLMEDPYMPVILEIKYIFKDTKVSPFFYINGGYTFALQTTDYEQENYYYYDYSSSIYPYPYYDTEIESHGGFVISPGFGFKINLNNKNAFQLNVGYRYMEVMQSYKDWNGQEIDRTLKYNRLVLGFTFQF